MLDKYIKFIFDKKYLTVLLMIPLIWFGVSGFQHFAPSDDYRVFFSDDNPQLQAFELLEKTYTKSDLTSYVVTSKTGTVFNQKALDAIEKITKESWQLPYSSRVDSITNYQHTEADGDDLYVEDLVSGALKFSNDDVEKVKKIALEHPLLVERLISKTGESAGITITHFIPPEVKGNAIFEIYEASEKLLAEYKKQFPDLEIRLAGSVRLAAAFGSVGYHDITTLYPLIFVVVFIFLMFFTRSIFASLASMAVILGAIVIGEGYSLWMGIVFSPPVFDSFIMIMTLAVADCVHIVTTFVQELRKGETKQAAIFNSIKSNFMPVFLTTFTTIIGFLTFNFSDSPPFQTLGNVVALGIFAAFVLSMTLLPALLAILPIKQNKKLVVEETGFEKLSNFVIEKRKVLLPSIGLVIVLLTSFLPKLVLDDTWIEYFDSELPVRVDTEYYRDNLAGITTVQYSLPAGEQDGINNPEYLTTVDQFVTWMREQKDVRNVNSYVDVIKRLNMNMNGGSSDFYRIPETREQAAQYLLLYEMSLPFGLDLNDQINVEKSATRVIVTMDGNTTEELLALDNAAQQWLKTNSPDYMHVSGSSEDIMFAYIGRNNINSMLVGIGIALIVISITLIFALKSFKIGILSIVSNMFPVLMGYGLWAILDGQIGLSLTVVAGMTLGIVVDDTVHFLTKYMRARRDQNLPTIDAVKYAFDHVGMAIIATTIILVAGFSVLLLSQLSMSGTMGVLTAIVITFALIVDFFFLPPLLLLFDKEKKPLTENKLSQDNLVTES